MAQTKILSFRWCLPLVLILIHDLFNIPVVAASVECYVCSSDHSKVFFHKNCASGPFDGVMHLTCSEPGSGCLSYNTGSVVERMCFPWDSTYGKYEDCLKKAGLGPNSCALSSRWYAEVTKCQGHNKVQGQAEMLAAMGGVVPGDYMNCYCSGSLCDTNLVPNPSSSTGVNFSKTGFGVIAFFTLLQNFILWKLLH